MSNEHIIEVKRLIEAVQNCHATHKTAYIANDSLRMALIASALVEAKAALTEYVLAYAPELFPDAVQARPFKIGEFVAVNVGAKVIGVSLDGSVKVQLDDDRLHLDAVDVQHLEEDGDQ